jgi:hypothetical protein
MMKKIKSGKGYRRSISKQVASRDRLQSVTDAKYDAAPRKSHERLGPWLGLANLLPPPPSPDERDRSPNAPAVGLRFQSWRARYRAERPAEFVRRFERSPLAQAPAITASLDLWLLRTNHDQARRFLDLAGEVATTLRTLVVAASPDVLKAAGDAPLLINRLFETPATSRSEIWIRKGAVGTRWVDPYKDFLAALEGVEAARVRQCPVCKRFFFALRQDQKACSKPCNAARRVRDWRAKQANYEYRRKLRGAELEAGERSKSDLK